MKRTFIISLLPLCFVFVFAACRGQTSPPQASSNSVERAVIGGPFENSEYGMIDRPAAIMSIDTSPGWNQLGQKLLVTGTIFENDGETPAPGVVLYYYHTNIAGRYQPSPELNPSIIRHGYIRGWVKSDEQGKYSIYTVRPGAYPDTDEPAHIHPSVYEPGLKQPYYLDAFVFDDDPLLTSAKRQRMLNRGGSGILQTVRRGELEVAHHDVILGHNIPAYPSGRTLPPKLPD
jgi:protocatechuate 3,4-dioxygenase beta subunit